MKSKVQNKQNAGKYEIALTACYNTLIEVNRLKIKLGGLGLSDLYKLIDEAEDKINIVYKKLDELH